MQKYILASILRSSNPAGALSKLKSQQSVGDLKLRLPFAFVICILKTKQVSSSFTHQNWNAQSFRVQIGSLDVAFQIGRGTR